MNTESQVSALIDNLPGMAYRCANDSRWTMLFVSAGALSLTGYTAADLMHNARVAYADLIHPDDRERVWQEVQQAMTDTRPFNMEYRIRDAAGTERWVWERGIHVWNTEGKAEYVEGFISDISARKQTENALRESQARYQHLFEMESDAIVLVESETGRILEVNQAACELYGYSKAEWLQMRHTDVSAEPNQTREAALKEQHLVPLRWHRKRDGTVFPVEITGSHFEWRGIRVHIAAIRDITERFRVGHSLAEERNRLRTLVDNLPDMIFIKDMEGRVISCNAAAIKFKGLAESEQAGKTVFDLNPADLARGYAEDDMRVLREGVTIQNREEQILDHADVMHWHITTKAPLRDQEGKIIGLVAICRNIDERKQAESRLADQLRELQRWHNATLGRETRILELKQQVNELLLQTGQPPRYPSALPKSGAVEGIDPALDTLP